MEYINEKIEEFNIIGIHCTTTNVNGQSMQDIGNLWKKFLADNIYSKITNRTDDKIIVAYTDFEGNPSDSAYKTIIGVQVSNLDNIPDGLIGKVVEASDYAVIEVTGTFPASLMTAWMASCNLDIERRFSTDLEIYPVGFNIENNSDMKIYINKQ